MSTGNSNDYDSSGVAYVKWKTVAVGSIIFALVSLTALAIVATINKADSLSVVALGLAVMAFVVQIIVFIVQNNAATKQAADTAALNAETLKALATIEAKSEGTQRTVGVMNERLLDFALNKATSELSTVNGTAESPDLSKKIIMRANEIINSSVSSDVAGSSVREFNYPPRPSIKNINSANNNNYFDTPLNPAEIKEVEEVLRAFPKDRDLALTDLYKLGLDKKKAEQAGHPKAAGMSTLHKPVFLYDLGLIKRVKISNSSTAFALSPKGELIARALIADTEPASSEIMSARRELRKFLVGVQENTKKLNDVILNIPVEE